MICDRLQREAKLEAPLGESSLFKLAEPSFMTGSSSALSWAGVQRVKALIPS